MYRLRYIYGMDDIVFRLEEFLNENYLIPPNRVRPWIKGILRGLFVKEFYFNLIPDPKIPYVHKDAFGILTKFPWMGVRLHQQIVRRRDLQEEWVRFVLTDQNDLFLEYDFRPVDFSVYWEGAQHVPNLPPRRDHPRARG